MELKQPYQDIIFSLVRSVKRALAEIVNLYENHDSVFNQECLIALDANINRHFVWLCLKFKEGENRHLFEGGAPLRIKKVRERSALPKDVSLMLSKYESLAPVSQKGIANELVGKHVEYIQAAETRISSIVKDAFFSVNEYLETVDAYIPLGKRKKSVTKLHTSGVVLLPSPEKIVLDYLTIPGQPESAAYPFFTLRNFLFESFEVTPEYSRPIKSKALIRISDIDEAMDVIWTSVRDRYASRGADPIPSRGKDNGFVRHFLAFKGLLNFRFTELSHAINFCESDCYHPNLKYELYKSDTLSSLPDSGEVVNEILGLPIPIRGADVLFRGGLRFSGRGGLVLAVQGGAGSGKTSFALSLGATLSAFGTTTLYLTSEESETDLHHRAETILPRYHKRMSFSPEKIDDWLVICPVTPPANDDKNFVSELHNQLIGISSSLVESNEESKDGPFGPPVPCKAVIVLDGIHDFLRAHHEADNTVLQKLIAWCRELDALIVLTTGEHFHSSDALDYLVDVSIALTHESVQDSGFQPTRLATLSKARHQLCSVGTHGLRLSGPKGFRFSPQIAYQLDRKAIYKTKLPQNIVVKHPFETASRYFSESELPLGGDSTALHFKSNSNILLIGTGSGGKAGLALKIATAPSYLSSIGDDHYSQVKLVERVLIISFLYPADYYYGLVEKLGSIHRQDYPDFPIPKPRIETIQLYPGALNANDLFNKIEWRLQSAELQGERFTCVILDGLHNVFLQFPNIEKQPLFWPQLYSALGKRDISVITTHTLLAVSNPRDSNSQYVLDDQKSEPLRHSLVQKTDYLLEVDRPRTGERGSGAKSEDLFAIRVVSAIGQPVPKTPVYWSREKLVFVQ